MRKNELVYLHELLHALKRHAEDRDGFPEGVLEGYESVGVTPLELYESKERHRVAVLVLARKLAATLDGRRPRSGDEPPKRAWHGAEPSPDDGDDSRAG